MNFKKYFGAYYTVNVLRGVFEKFFTTNEQKPKRNLMGNLEPCRIPSIVGPLCFVVGSIYFLSNGAEH